MSAAGARTDTAERQTRRWYRKAAEQGELFLLQPFFLGLQPFFIHVIEPMSEMVIIGGRDGAEIKYLVGPAPGTTIII